MDQFDQTIKFCNFKISKGKDMPISEIIEMKKMGDPTLSTLIEVTFWHMTIEPYPTETKRNFSLIKYRSQ
jgi:hypothetical protein